MFWCAQLADGGICRTVAMLKEEVTGDNIIPIEPGKNVMGMKHIRETNQWYTLTVTAANRTTAQGVAVTVTVSWVTENGLVVADPDPVTATCDGFTTEVPVVDGVGDFEFAADVAGSYRVTVRSTAGAEAEVEVLVE